MALYRGLDLCANHSVLDVRIVRDRIKRDTLNPLINKAVSNVVSDLSVRKRLSSQILLLSASVDRVRQQVIGEPRSHDSLTRER